MSISLALLALPGLLTAIAFALWIHSMLGWRRVERECPPIGTFVEVDGLRTHYFTRGEGAAVVLIHGASGNLRDLTSSLGEAVARRHRVIAIDRPGFGYSERPRGAWPDPAVQARLLRKTLQRLGIERPVLVGHSWGGALALAYALEWPDELAGLVTICPVSHPWPGGVALYRRVAVMPVLGRLLASTVLWPFARRVIDRGVTGTLAPDPVPDDYRRVCGIDLLLRPTQFRADAQDVVGLSDFLAQQSRRYERLRVPLTIVTGTHDSVVSTRLQSRQLHDRVAGSRLVVLEGAGHAPHHAHASAIVSEIDRVVATAASRLADAS